MKIDLEDDEWNEILANLKDASYQSISSHREFIVKLIAKIDEALKPDQK